MTYTSSYPVRFASPKRDSALPVATSAEGKVSWSCDLDKWASPDWPPTVLIWGDREVVATYSDMILIDRQGKQLWTRPNQGGSPIAIAQDCLYFKGTDLFLEALNTSDRPVITEGPFPAAMSNKVTVRLSWPREHDFIAVLYRPPEDSVADGDPPGTHLRGAETTVLRNRYETTYGDWLATYPGSPVLPPLLLPERNVLTLFIDGALRVDVEQEEDLSHFKVPLEQPLEWSVDAGEIYSVIGYQGGRKTLLAVSGSGQELWRWTDTQDNDAWVGLQPPIHGPEGRIYVLTEGRVLAIDRGKLLWQFDARSDSLRHGAHLSEGSFQIQDGRLLAVGALRHGSALSDGSLLVTINKTLYHLSAEGREIFSVTVDGDILSPPVADDRGNIYIATASRLFQIQ